MQTSCGFLIESNNKWLICHPTRSKYWDLPKGKKEENETDLQTAIRELDEETGIILTSGDIVDIIDLGLNSYNKEKKLHLFKIKIDNLNIDDLNCSMMVTTKKNETFPEMDKFLLVSPEKAIEMVSPSMRKWLSRNLKIT